MKNSKLLLWGALDSFGTTAYILLVALFMSNIGKWFGNKPDNAPLPAIVMLLLLVLSASITGALVLGRPVYMYFNGQKPESVRLFLYTLACLLSILVIVFIVYLLI